MRWIVAGLLLALTPISLADRPGGSGSICPLPQAYIQKLNADVHDYLIRTYTDVGKDPTSPAYSREAGFNALIRVLIFDRQNGNQFADVRTELTALDKKNIPGYPNVNVKTYKKHVWEHPTHLLEVSEVMQRAFVARGVTQLPIDLGGPESMPMLIPIAAERISPLAFDLLPIRVVLGGDDVQPYAFYQVADYPSRSRIHWYGFTQGEVGVLNTAYIDRLAEQLEQPINAARSLAIKHETTHIELFRRYGFSGSRTWPLEKISEYLRSPFPLQIYHIEEILSDAATLVGAYENLYATEYHAFDQTRPHNLGSFVYGGVALTLVRALEAAEKETMPEEPKARVFSRYLLESRPEDGSTPNLQLKYATRLAMTEHFVKIAQHIARMIEGTP